MKVIPEMRRAQYIRYLRFQVSSSLTILKINIGKSFQAENSVSVHYS